MGVISSGLNVAAAWRADSVDGRERPGKTSLLNTLSGRASYGAVGSFNCLKQTPPQPWRCCMTAAIPLSLPEPIIDQTVRAQHLSPHTDAKRR